MRDLWKSLAMLAAVGLVVLLPAPASASVIEAAPVSASIRPVATPPDFTPSAGGWRKWMVNVLGSLFKGSTTNAYKAEQIANQFQYNTGWESLNAKFGIDGIRVNEAGQMVGVKFSNIGSGTYTDVVIDGLEQSYKNPAAIGTGPVRAPATALKTAGKVVGAVGAVITAYDLGATLGSAGTNWVGSWFGFDANAAVCSQVPAEQGGALGPGGEVTKWVWRALSGQDCNAWDMAHTYTPNADAPKGFDDPGIAGLVLPKFQGSATVSGGVQACYDKPGTTPSGYAVFIKLANGSTTGVGSWTPAGANSFCTSIGKTGTGYAGWASTQGGSWLPLQVTGPSGYKWTQTATMTDPDRTVKCTLTFTDSTTLSGPSSDPFKESTGTVAPPQCPDVPPGKVPSNVTVTESTAGPGVPDQTIYDQPTTAPYKQWVTNFPECGTGACKLDLINIQKQKSCFDLQDGCPDWMADPNKTTNYQCRYGVHNVDISECYLYGELFQPGHTTAGAPWSDPSTGHWSGGQNAPTEASQLMGHTLQDPTKLRSCDFASTGFDPVGWIMRGGQCVLEWAFVPRQTVVNVAFAGANQGWEHKPPAVIAQAVGSMVVSPSASGCSKSVTYSGVSFNILDACSGPMGTIAQYSRWITSAGFVVLGIVMLRRRIAAAAGYNVGQG